MSSPQNILSSIGGAISGVANQVENLLGIAGQSASINPQEDITLIVGGSRISGWTRLRVTRGIERLPSDFDIELTEKYPGTVSNVIVQAGDPCSLKIGGDTVVTGYVDRYIPSIDGENHTIRVTGRGKCQDMVDCSAQWPNSQISGTNALDIAMKLAKPFNVKVVPPASDFTLIPIPQFNILYTSTPADIIEQITRYSGLLYYENAEGDLVLSEVSRNKAASGFAQGINVLKAQATFTKDQRFRFIRVRQQSMAIWHDVSGGNPGADVIWPQPVSTVADEGVTRYRVKNIHCESGALMADWAQLGYRRYYWEVNRRWGRSYKADITVDSWRDAAGKLWEPNTLVNIHIPACRLLNTQYVISEVTLQRDEESGTTARIVAMPAAAFSIEPLLLQNSPVPEAGAALPIPGRPDAPRGTSTAPQPAVTATSPMTDDQKRTAILGIFDSPDPGTDGRK